MALREVSKATKKSMGKKIVRRGDRATQNPVPDFLPYPLPRFIATPDYQSLSPILCTYAGATASISY